MTRHELMVERSAREYDASTRGLAFLDPEAMGTLAVAPGAVLRLVSYLGHSVLVRAAEPNDADRGGGGIRLDRFQRQALRARLGEKVSVYPVDARPVTRVELQPSVDMTTALTHHLEQHLHERLVEERALVSPGMVLFARFHHSVAGTTYRVVATEPGPGVVDERTEIRLRPTPEAPGEVPTLDVTFDDVGGLAAELDIVREMVQIPLTFPAIYRQLGVQPPRGLIFHGPPGTGKTHLARAIANELNAAFYIVDGPGIVGSMYGETEGNLRRIFGEASHHAPSIILIDEIDVLAPKRGETGAHSDTRVVTQLLSLMDGLSHVEGVIVVATTNRIHALDEALRRPGRFDREIFFGPPAEAARREILAVHTREMPLSHPAESFLGEVARRTPGYVGADLREVCRESGMNALRRLTADQEEAWGAVRLLPDRIRVEPEDFVAALRRVRPSASRLVMTRSVSRSFAEVGGVAEAKAFLRVHLVDPLRDEGLRSTLGPGALDGVLLYGPPGSGKTLLAAATAGEAGANLVVVDGPELFTKWLGQTEEGLRQAFELARRLAPTVLFFDQIDALTPRRSLDSGSRTTERVVSQLLAELDDLADNPAPVGVLAATNRIDLVDRSVLRPGRVGLLLNIPAPDQAGRSEILRLEIERYGMVDDAPTDDQLDELARTTQGMSGADLAWACREAWRLRLAAGGIGSADGGYLLPTIQRLVNEHVRQQRALLDGGAAEPD